MRIDPQTFANEYPTQFHNYLVMDFKHLAVFNVAMGDS